MTPLVCVAARLVMTYAVTVGSAARYASLLAALPSARWTWNAGDRKRWSPGGVLADEKLEEVVDEAAAGDVRVGERRSGLSRRRGQPGREREGERGEQHENAGEAHAAVLSVGDRYVTLSLVTMPSWR
jgi:hypothetical protein